MKHWGRNLFRYKQIPEYILVFSLATYEISVARHWPFEPAPTFTFWSKAVEIYMHPQKKLKKQEREFPQKKTIILSYVNVQLCTWMQTFRRKRETLSFKTKSDIRIQKNKIWICRAKKFYKGNCYHGVIPIETVYEIKIPRWKRL